ncbi:ABC transporter permease [Candidatus Soleaferrea massiliensis]|uniref:ABC transporter permease n=1 Tax=Candidatus Soleaferrea massiliensis TaxID=1470354 RepID=UPI0009E4AA08|nr:FtsX-like permease family protein [Candidatus Soleaferrea massiliensis]
MLKQSLLFILRKPAVTAVLLLIFILFGTVEFVGLTMGWSAYTAKTETINAIGYQLLLAANDNNNPIEQSTIDTVEKLDHVVGTNYYLLNTAIPVDFEMVYDHEGANPSTQPPNDDPFFGEVGEICFEGNSRNDLFSDFRRGLAKLIQGEFPSEEHRGVLIEKRLANKNHLKLGDSITLQSRSQKKLTTKVVGIFQTNATFEITDDNYLGEKVYAGSPYNRIMCDVETAREFQPKGADPLSLEIYVDSPGNLQSVQHELEKFLSPDDYQITNITRFDYEIVGKQVESVYSLSQTVIFFTCLIAIVILLFSISLYSKSIVKEAGILLALGATKKGVILCRVFQLSLTGVTGTLLSLIPGSIIVLAFSSNLLPKVVEDVNMTTISSSITNSGIVLPPTITLEHSLWVLLFLFVIILAVALLSGIYTAFYILTCKPREILLHD